MQSYKIFKYQSSHSQGMGYSSAALGLPAAGVEECQGPKLSLATPGISIDGAQTSPRPIQTFTLSHCLAPWDTCPVHGVSGVRFTLHLCLKQKMAPQLGNPAWGACTRPEAAQREQLTILQLGSPGTSLPSGVPGTPITLINAEALVGSAGKTRHSRPSLLHCPVNLHMLISPASVCWSSQSEQGNGKAKVMSAHPAAVPDRPRSG